MKTIQIYKRKFLFFLCLVAEFDSFEYEAYISSSGVLRIQYKGQKSAVVAAFSGKEWDIVHGECTDYSIK